MPLLALTWKTIRDQTETYVYQAWPEIQEVRWAERPDFPNASNYVQINFENPVKMEPMGPKQCSQQFSMILTARFAYPVDAPADLLYWKAQKADQFISLIEASTLYGTRAQNAFPTSVNLDELGLAEERAIELQIAFNVMSYPAWGDASDIVVAVGGQPVP